MEDGYDHWRDGDDTICDRLKGLLLVYRNVLHHCDTGALMVVATDWGNVYGIGPGHGTHSGIDNT